MSIDSWKYYNHAMIPSCSPHEVPDLKCIENGDIWRIGTARPLLARWTTDWDCGYETNFWYVIKDSYFDISQLKAKRRYEINKGIKNFEVKIIDYNNYIEDLFEVQKAAFSVYPKAYRPVITREGFLNDIKSWNKYKIYAAFEKENYKLCGYALIKDNEKYAEFSVLKTIPEYENKALNAAIVYKIVIDFNDKLSNGYYILDGARAINHETHFQDYLEKYFLFRKSYCKLHIKYKFPLGIFVSCLYPFRNLFSNSNAQSLHKISAILKMEAIRKNKE